MLFISEQADCKNGEKSSISASLILWDCSASQRCLETLSLGLEQGEAPWCHGNESGELPIQVCSVRQDLGIPIRMQNVDHMTNFS